MKKNFLMVASLLIAAMLMVVSCTQEVASKNELVEARISVGYGRDLTVENETKTSDLVYTYTMSHQWDDLDSVSERIYGDQTTEKPFTDKGSIGYVTPGLWSINVKAYNAGSVTTNEQGVTVITGNPLFSGNANAYFSNQKKDVVVYLAPVENQTNYLSFDITMQDLVGTGNGVTSGAGSYELRYEIEGKGSYTGLANASSPALTGTLAPNKNEGKDTTTYKLAGNDSKVSLKSGFYTVTVSVYSIEEGSDDKLVGGIRKGFLLAGNANATVKGHIEPSDYEKITVDALYIDVKTAVEVEKVDGVEKITYTPASGSEGAKASVKFYVDDNTDETTDENTIAKAEKSYVWYVADNGTTTPISSNTDEFTVTFKAPGYKTVTCQTIYTVTDDTTGKKYFFADTKSNQVFIEPDKF